MAFWFWVFLICFGFDNTRKKLSFFPVVISWQKYGSENSIREYYFSAKINGLSIASQEWSDRDGKASALLVVPINRHLS